MALRKAVLDSYDEEIKIAGRFFSLFLNPKNRWEIKFQHERGFTATIATTFESKRIAKNYLEKFYEKKCKHIRYL